MYLSKVFTFQLVFNSVCSPTSSMNSTHLPLILILSDADFLPSKLGKILMFPGMGKCFLYNYIQTDFFPKILIFLVIYTDFVLDQSGRSVCINIMVYWDC